MQHKILNYIFLHVFDSCLLYMIQKKKEDSYYEKPPLICLHFHIIRKKWLWPVFYLPVALKSQGINRAILIVQDFWFIWQMPRRRALTGTGMSNIEGSVILFIGTTKQKTVLSFWLKHITLSKSVVSYCLSFSK